MSESISQRLNAMANHKDADQLYQLIVAVRADLEALRLKVNTHVHSGVTAGGANTAAPTTTVASLNTTL